MGGEVGETGNNSGGFGQMGNIFGLHVGAPLSAGLQPGLKPLQLLKKATAFNSIASHFVDWWRFFGVKDNSTQFLGNWVMGGDVIKELLWA